MKPQLLASSPTLEGARKAIARFYGEEKRLMPAGDNQWMVLRASGAQIDGVRIIKRAGRYRFEATQ